MARSKKHFQEFQPHSLLKHAILTAYLEAWAPIMLLRPRATSTICIVDACAGAGMDDKGNPGSPLLAARVAKATEDHLQGDERLRSRLTAQVRIDLTAIEKDARLCSQLSDSLAPFGERVRVVHGTLADHIEDHFANYGDTPTLFFIDPFGLAPLSADVIRRALSGPHNEVFLLFADQAALRHFGAISAATPDLEAVLAARLPRQGSLFEDVAETESRIRAEVADAVVKKTEGQRITRSRAIEILDTAFGGDRWLPIIESTPKAERRARFIELYVRLLYDAGAIRVLPLPMRNHRDQHVYTLLFATRSLKGYTEMKEAVGRSLKKAVLPEDVLVSLRFQISSDLDAVEAAVRRRFAGGTYPWSNKTVGKPTIADYVLESTEAFGFELQELKRRLRPLKAARTANGQGRGRVVEMYSFSKDAAD